MTGKLNICLLQKFIQKSPAYESVRLYGRWMHRSPAKVLLPIGSNDKSNLKKEKIIDLDPAIFKNKCKHREDKAIDLKDRTESLTISPEKSKQIKQSKEEILKKKRFHLSQQKVFDDNGDIIYEKLKENDGFISSLLVNLKSKKERLRSHQTLVEGWRLIVDGLEAKCNLNYVLFSRTSDLNKIRPFLPNTGVRFYKISYKELQLWSDVETSPGIIGVFETPKAEIIKRRSSSLPLQFICDNVRVPGNLGAILRVAVGVGCQKVLLSKGCVDVWDPKVIRSAAGAHFRLPIYHSIEWNDMANHLESNTSLFIADNKISCDDEISEANENQIDMPVIPYYSIEYSTLHHTTLIIGGETEGISEDSYSLAASKNGLRLNIPLERGVDSLNTGMATAVIAFEIKKQLIQAWSKPKLERQMVEAS